MRGAVPCLSADLTTRAFKNTLEAMKIGRRAPLDGSAVMGVVSADAVRGFLACIFPGLIIAMTATCAILRRFDNSTAFRRFHARASAAAPGKTKRTVSTAAHNIAMTAATAQERAAAAVPQM